MPPTLLSEFKRQSSELYLPRVSLDSQTLQSERKPAMPRCARVGCPIRKSVLDTREAQCNGGWLCTIHRNELRLSVAEITQKVLTERTEGMGKTVGGQRKLDKEMMWKWC
ncbi:hypothetical protein CC86DRAFT_53192 [Ophiobolus disseminans]|uniref:Uncharacterized protein n=1 Tax=Ophiobolus disseminans TaxID=1469910 RepID=A0A6A6ZT89_9PLEO|nr:hypothetical protein CC86DRAFT_53192 [Ophiobolus disseminans]